MMKLLPTYVAFFLLVTALAVVSSEQTLASTSATTEILSDTLEDSNQLLDAQTEEENETGSDSDIDHADGGTRPPFKRCVMCKLIFPQACLTTRKTATMMERPMFRNSLLSTDDTVDQGTSSLAFLCLVHD